MRLVCEFAFKGAVAWFFGWMSTFSDSVNGLASESSNSGLTTTLLPWLRNTFDLFRLNAVIKAKKHPEVALKCTPYSGPCLSDISGVLLPCVVTSSSTLFLSLLSDVDRRDRSLLWLRGGSFWLWPPPPPPTKTQNPFPINTHPTGPSAVPRPELYDRDPLSAYGTGGHQLEQWETQRRDVMLNYWPLKLTENSLWFRDDGFSERSLFVWIFCGWL